MLNSSSPPPSLRRSTGPAGVLQRLAQHFGAAAQHLLGRCGLTLRNGTAVQVAQPESDPLLRFIEECGGQGPVLPGEGGGKVAQFEGQQVKGYCLGDGLRFMDRFGGGDTFAAVRGWGWLHWDGSAWVDAPQPAASGEAVQ